MYDYFLAHASSDKTHGVRQLHRALRDAGLKVFLDEADILPGDDWDLEIPRHHRDSKATLVLVSTTYERAYYLRDEVHTALRWARDPATGHRVVPLYLDGFPDPMPYGLTVKNGLDLQALGQDEVVRRLVVLAGSLPATRPPPPPPPPPCDRRALYDALVRLQTDAPSAFQDLVFFDFPEAVKVLPDSPRTTPADRALALVQWAGLQGDALLQRLWDGVKRVAPALLP